MVEMTEALLTVEDVAERLGVSTRLVYRHADTWPFAVRVGGLLRFDPAGLRDWLASGGDSCGSSGTNRRRTGTSGGGMLQASSTKRRRARRTSSSPKSEQAESSPKLRIVHPRTRSQKDSGN